MPERFPTFNAVAALGLLVVLLRTIALERMIRSIPRFAQRITALMDAGKYERALALCEQYPVAVYPPVARRLLLLAERFGDNRPEAEVRARLVEAFDAAHSVQVLRQRSSRARDLAALIVLGGAVAYLGSWGTGASPTFYALCGAGATFLAWGILSRNRLLSVSHQQRDGLVEACVRASRRMAAAHRDDDRCPTCGAELPSSRASRRSTPTSIINSSPALEGLSSGNDDEL